MNHAIIKSVICIVAAVFLLVIITTMACLKSTPIYAKNDKENYSVYYQKWIKVIMFMGTIILALFSIVFAIRLKIVLSLILLFLETIMVVLYALCKYKCVTVNGEKITVERLFQKKFETNYDDIQSVYYVPNAKIVVRLKKKDMFELSFNSENFHRFFVSLMEHKVKFKTAHIRDDENHVCLTKYNMTIHFPKTMFRDYYQQKRFFHNSVYLFSARSLEHEWYMEGHYKESNKNIEDFIEIVKSDLAINDFTIQKDSKENFNGFDFNVITCKDNLNKEYARNAYIYKDTDNYLVLYCDYLKEDEETFKDSMKSIIAKTRFEDSKSRLVKI